jgi:hypothetical protein
MGAALVTMADSAKKSLRKTRTARANVAEPELVAVGA